MPLGGAPFFPPLGGFSGDGRGEVEGDEGADGEEGAGMGEAVGLAGRPGLGFGFGVCATGEVVSSSELEDGHCPAGLAFGEQCFR